MHLHLLSANAHGAETQKSAFQRPLRIVVPFAPGGGQDTTARILAPKLTEITGQQVIVDNRPGGAGIIAAETLLKAPADGHTMYLAVRGNRITLSHRTLVARAGQTTQSPSPRACGERVG